MLELDVCLKEVVDKWKPEACLCLTDSKADDGSMGRAVRSIIGFTACVVENEARQVKDK